MDNLLYNVEMKPPTKSDPVPVRFDEPEHEGLVTINDETGLNKGEIIRRACRFAFPKFISGEVDICRAPDLTGATVKGEAVRSTSRKGAARK